MEITTNNHVRPVVYGYELSSKELTYLGMDSVEDASAIEEWQGFRYKGTVYALNEFEVVQVGGELESLGWQGATAESYWSGKAIRFSDDSYGDAGIVVANITWG